MSNILVHREYSKGFPARIVVESDRIYAENWNRSNRHGRIDPSRFTPEPKNPILARFFLNIGRADKLGSGVRNLYKYTKIYSGGEPELIEGDIFKTIVPLKGIGALGSIGSTPYINVTGKLPNNVKELVDDQINDRINDRINRKTQESILTALKTYNSATHDQLAISVGVSEATVKRNLKKLQELGMLKRIGSRKTGYWEIIE